jgi:hypothetical protein
MNLKESDVVKFCAIALVSLTALLLEVVGRTGATTLKVDRSQCYKYLTELVRSSNFSSVYVKNEKINLLIDDDQGETVIAQLFFDTDGSGTADWVKYNVKVRELLNISADLEKPQSLHYEKRYAEQYKRCIGGGWA